MSSTLDTSAALKHLRQSDKKLAALIKRIGPCALVSKQFRNPFQALIRSIIYQQLSGKAAATIHGRVVDLFPTKAQVTPKNLIKLSDTKLRSAGVSGQKAKALRDLTQKALDGQVPGYAKLKKMEDQEIIELLTDIRGVGVWTVQMLLIFQLGRPDVFPIDDLGVRKGYAITYNKRKLPTPKELLKKGEPWRPYRSVASWYMWRATDVKA